MARTRNRIEAISSDFDALDSMAQVDIVSELFTRLDAGQSAHAMMLINFWRKRQGYQTETGTGGVYQPIGRKPYNPKPPRGGSGVPPLMERSEVETAGKLALAKTEGPKQ